MQYYLTLCLCAMSIFLRCPAVDIERERFWVVTNGYTWIPKVANAIEVCRLKPTHPDDMLESSARFRTWPLAARSKEMQSMPKRDDASG